VDHHVRRRALAARLPELEVDALLVTTQLHTRYLTGFTGSNGQVLVTPEGDLLMTDGRYTEQSRREAPDVERLTYAEHFHTDLVARARAAKIARLGFESEDVTVAGHEKLAEVLGDEVSLVALSGVVGGQRIVKDDDERDMIRHAQAATDAAFESIMERFAIGVSERQIARELERMIVDGGGDGLAFESIVAFGENAAEPHHRPTTRLLEEGDVIKLDFGALVGGYHSDMTRTIAFGPPASELKKIHDVVRQAQQAGIDAVRAGVTGAQVDAASRDVIADAGYGDRFVHGLGHGVGLEIHEPPWLGKTQQGLLPAGAVVTVEPGIYIPGLGGVRIEDMVEVTEDGGRVVGTSTRDLIEL
jgi:Xaa-Pro dipeptidase